MKRKRADMNAQDRMSQDVRSVIQAADGILADQCDQRRLACSVGGSPTGAIVRTP
jgi:hypothetical protein